jgi:hypothetical protein
MERVIAYVDGFNLYYGLKEAGYERYLWLDVHGLVRNILNPATQTLVRVNYFTSRVSDPPEKVARRGRRRPPCCSRGGSPYNELAANGR